MGLLNARRKLDFIKAYTKSKGTEKNLQWLFQKAFELESKKSKDLIYFNKEDYVDFIKLLGVRESTANMHLAYLSSYIDHCYKHEYINRDNVIKKHRKDILRESFSDRSTYFTFKEISELTGRTDHNEFNKLLNIQDQLLIELVFLGVLGKQYYELINLKFTDLDQENNILNIPQEDGSYRQIKVDSYTVELFKESRNEEIYFRYGVDVSAKNTIEGYPLVQSDYVFRKSEVGKVDGYESKVSMQTISHRSLAIKNHIGTSFNLKKVEKSGVLYNAKRIVEHYQRLELSDLNSLFERFNITKKNMQYSTMNFIRAELPKLYPDVKEYMK